VWVAPGDPTLLITTLVRLPCVLLAEALQRRAQEAGASSAPVSSRMGPSALSVWAVSDRRTRGELSAQELAGHCGAG
jgi:hypothetical protein